MGDRSPSTLTAEATVDVGGKPVLMFHPTHKRIKDGIPRCISCGQIDEDGYHDARWCPGMGGDLPFATSTLKLTLKADSGFNSQVTVRITLAQWRMINAIINADPDVSRAIIDQNGDAVGTAKTPVLELVTVEGFTDDEGTVWTPPTAYAYQAACKALRAAKAA